MMKVSRRVYFLLLIIEECAEIIHRTCKAIRFGMDERWKPEHKSNRELLEGELVDLRTIVALNVQEGNLGPDNPHTILNEMQHKRERVANFFTYSCDACKTVLPDADEGYNPPNCYVKWGEDQRAVQAGTVLPKDKLQAGMRVVCPRCKAVLRITDAWDKGIRDHEAATGPDNALCGGGSEFELFEKFVQPK